MKVAVILISDPENGHDALGKAFNALALASECLSRKDEVELVFTGAGTGWPETLADPSHPLHALYNSVGQAVSGVCTHCAEVFGNTEAVKHRGLAFIGDNPVPGTKGVASLRRYLAMGWQVLLF